MRLLSDFLISRNYYGKDVRNNSSYMFQIQILLVKSLCYKFRFEKRTSSFSGYFLFRSRAVTQGGSPLSECGSRD